MVSFEVTSLQREQMIDITDKIQASIPPGFSGACTAFTAHTTAGLTINENADPDVTRDILQGLRNLVPVNGGYRHTEGNSDAHIKSSLVGSSITLIVENGRLVLGTWQGAYFCEFDGPRRRRVYLTFLPAV